MEKLNGAQKCSILGSQNLGSRGGEARVLGLPPGSAPVHRVNRVMRDKCVWVTSECIGCMRDMCILLASECT